LLVGVDFFVCSLPYFRMIDRFHSPHILLVEDDYTDADLIQRCLRWSNRRLHINWVDDGIEALDYLRHCLQESLPLPDLMIMDLKMPKRSGSEILSDIRALPGLDQLPIAILSSSPLEEDLSRIRALGVDEFFIKPIDLSDLRETIHRILARWDLTGP
jgi:CheY-like chemotaxis protein